MAQHRFSLNSVRTMRKAERDTCQRQLAAAIAAVDGTQQEQEAIRTRLNDLRRAQRAHVTPGRVDLDTLRDTHRCNQALRDEQEHLAQELTAFAADVEACRNSLVEAERQLRILEKLETRETARQQDGNRQRNTRELNEARLQSHQRSNAVH